jgi:peptidoglycan/xylan/chitin deacetylase (PgdA/CDA1 family)
VRPRALGWLGIPAVLAAALLVRAAISNPAAAPSDHDAAGPTASGSSSSPAGLVRGGAGDNPPLSDDPASASAPTTDPGRADSDVTSSGTTDPGATGTDPTSTFAPGDRPRVTSSSPSGVRVPLDSPVVVKFDRAPEKQAITLTLEPPAKGQITWPDPQTLTFTPARWADGKPYHVRVEGEGVAPATFEFRTLFPPPERIEPGHGERVTLTFDDGADRPAQVTALLDLLQKEDIQAIFFPTGRWAEANPHLVERMIRDGHRVCNHTYSHQNLRLPQLTEEEIRTEITRGAGDGKCRLFRPPLKAFDPRVERIVAALGYTLYLWDVDSRDWEGAATEDIVNLVLARIHPGAVVLFHMHQQTSLDALPRILPRLRKAGYVFRDPPDAGAP